MKDEKRDFSIIYHINKHYEELNYYFKNIDTLDDFSNSKAIRKAILFDFLQMGELMNSLSKSFKVSFNNKHLFDLISIRHRIVHTYSGIHDDIIFNTLKNDVPKFMNQLLDFSKRRYKLFLHKLLGENIKVFINNISSLDSYSVIAGYTESITSLDGEFQKVCVLDSEDSESIINCFIIAILEEIQNAECFLVAIENKINLRSEEVLSIIKHVKNNKNYKLIECNLFEQ